MPGTNAPSLLNLPALARGPTLRGNALAIVAAAAVGVGCESSPPPHASVGGRASALAACNGIEIGDNGIEIGDNVGGCDEVGGGAGTGGADGSGAAGMGGFGAGGFGTGDAGGSGPGGAGGLGTGGFGVGGSGAGGFGAGGMVGGPPYGQGGFGGAPGGAPPDGQISETAAYFATVVPKDLTQTDDLPIASEDELREAVMCGLDEEGSLKPYVGPSSSPFYHLSVFDVSTAELAIAELVRRSTLVTSANAPPAPVPPPAPPPPNGDKTVNVSLRLARFIPDSLGKAGPNLIIDMGGGKKENAWPFTLLVPSLGPTARFFFGDNRGFSADPNRKGRVNVKVDGSVTYDAENKLKSLGAPKLEAWADKTRDFVPTADEDRKLREAFGASSAYAINHAAAVGKPGIPGAWPMPASMLEELQATVKHVTTPEVKVVEGNGFKQIAFNVNVRGWHPGITTPPDSAPLEDLFKIAAVRAKMVGYVRFYDQCKIEVKAEIDGSAFPYEDLSIRVGDEDVPICTFTAKTINGMPLRHPETGLMYDRPTSTCRALRETCGGPWKTADVSSATANAEASLILGSPFSLAQPHLAGTLLQIERDAIANGVPPADKPVNEAEKKEFTDAFKHGKNLPANALCARGPSGAYTGLVKIDETSAAAKSYCTNAPTKYTPGTPQYQSCYEGYIAGVTTVCIGARP